MFRADFGSGLVAVHFGHLEVHEDEVEGGWIGLEGFDRFEAVIGDRDRGAGALKEFAGDLLVDFVIFREEDTGALEEVGVFIWLGGFSVVAVGLAEDIDEAIDQHGLGDGLHEEAIDVKGFGFGADFFASEGGDHDDGGDVFEVGVVFDLAGGLETVDFGHAPIHEDHLVRFRGIPFVECGEGFAGGGDGVDFGGDAAQGAEEDFAGGGVVVDDEGAEVLEFRREDAGGFFRAGLEVDDEVEAAAFTGFTFEPDAAMHEFDEAFGDGEAKAGAAVFPGGGHVGLGEGLEQAGGLFRGHADAGVGDREFELDGGIGMFEQFGCDADLAFLGELDGVIDEVGDDLAEAKGVAAEVLGDIGRDFDEELKALFVGFLGGDRGDGVDDLVELEVDVFYIEFTGFDFGDVEDVVDDAEEGGAGGMDLMDVVVLFGGEFSFEGEVSQADDGVHGGADFVAHIGEEHGFHGGGFLGLGFCLLEFLLGGASFGDIREADDSAGDLLIFYGGGGAVFDGEAGAVFTEEDFIIDATGFALGIGGEHGAILDGVGLSVGVVVVEEVVGWLADEFGWFVTEHAAG
ncbi:MAG: hypothetical protein RI897_3587 [Verrucomicrobiota bacterium]